MPTKKTTGRAVKVERVEALPTIYANSVQIDQSPFDLRMRIGQLQTATNQELVIKELVHIYMSPQHAKALLGVLGAVVRKWEERHGMISALSSEEVAGVEH